MNPATPQRVEHQLTDKGYVPVYTTAVVEQPCLAASGRRETDSTPPARICSAVLLISALRVISSNFRGRATRAIVLVRALLAH